MAITKEMLARCQNELKQAFCALDDDVQKVIVENTNYAESLWNKHGAAIWEREMFTTMKTHFPWRISPDTPTEPEWVEYAIEPDKEGDGRVRVGGGVSDYRWVWVAMFRKDFLGIIYLKDGTETLRTSVDAAFGTPVRVRFSK